MREMEFKMEREGLVEPGQKIQVTRGVSPFLNGWRAGKVW